MQDVKSGVPQGSILGPVCSLFSLLICPFFINEAYANKDTIVVAYKLQNGAIGFWTWCRNNKMFNHFIKTSVLTIRTRYHTSRTDPMSIIIDNEQIQNVESQKLLGVSIDRTLSWDKQIDVVFKYNKKNQTFEAIVTECRPVESQAML